MKKKRFDKRISKFKALNPITDFVVAVLISTSDDKPNVGNHKLKFVKKERNFITQRDDTFAEIKDRWEIVGIREK